MNLAVVRTLVEMHALNALRAAEDSLLNEQRPDIDVPGVDEGDQLTNVLGAIWVHERMRGEQMDLRSALRDYTRMVRGSIT
jgi:hypothetical protein